MKCIHFVMLYENTHYHTSLSHFMNMNRLKMSQPNVTFSDKIYFACYIELLFSQ